MLFRDSPVRLVLSQGDFVQFRFIGMCAHILRCLCATSVCAYRPIDL